MLIIFVKQKTYLTPSLPAELSNLKRTQKYQILKMAEEAASPGETGRPNPYVFSKK
jgi:hypothetical protein